MCQSEASAAVRKGRHSAARADVAPCSLLCFLAAATFPSGGLTESSNDPASHAGGAKAVQGDEQALRFYVLNLDESRDRLDFMRQQSGSRGFRAACQGRFQDF
jgi:hypothetical protein